MRGQLQLADATALMGLMNRGNETPPITGQDASGVSQAVVIATRDSSGALTSGQVIFDINYNFGKQVTITGFHIHNGAAGVARPGSHKTRISGRGTVPKPANAPSQPPRAALDAPNQTEHTA